MQTYSLGFARNFFPGMQQAPVQAKPYAPLTSRDVFFSGKTAKDKSGKTAKDKSGKTARDRRDEAKVNCTGISEEEIKSLESVLTILGGKPVYAAEEFKPLDPGDLPVMPDWSPVHHYPGYWKHDHHSIAHACCGHEHHGRLPVQNNSLNLPQWILGPRGPLDGGCECFAF